MTTLSLDIQHLDNTHTAPTDAQFASWVYAALENAGFTQNDAEVSIAIVSSDSIASLNHQYRHKKDSTNVLSFPAEFPEGIDVPLLGDIIICSEVVEKEAVEQDKTLEAHWAHMTVHGVLHLLGFDHIIEPEAEDMESLETRILNGLGYNNPYEIQIP